MGNGIVIQSILSPEVEKSIRKLESAVQDANKELAKSIELASSIKAPTNFADRAKNNQKVNKQLTEQGKLINNLRQAKRQLALVASKENRALQETRQERNKANREIRKASDAYGRLSLSLKKAEESYRNLLAQSKEGKVIDPADIQKAKAQVLQLRGAIDSINEPIKRGNKNVGRYFEDIMKSAKYVLGSLGLIAGASEIVNFAKDARKLALEAKGVEFSFNRIAGSSQILQEAIEKVDGSLSDLEIQKAINKFNNFNLNIQELPELLEFVSVRAAQTGDSFEYLFDSLVEGLAKESKLRIDNLGISAADLNKELEKTPNFVKAVANIAKKEIGEAGDVLNQGANAQQKFNVAIANAKREFGEFVLKGVNPFVEGLGLGVTRLQNFVKYGNAFITQTEISKKKLAEQVKELENQRVGLESSTSALINLIKAEKQDETTKRAKKILVSEINTKYGEYLPQLISERDTIDQIRIVQEMANKEYLKKQIFLKYQSEISEALDSELEARKSLAKLRVDEEKKSGLFEDVTDTYGLSSNSKALLEFNETIAEGVKETAETIIDTTAEKTDKIKQIYNEMAKDIGTTLQDIDAQFTQASKTEFSTNEQPTKEQTKAKEKAIEIEKTLIQELEESYKALLKQRTEIGETIKHFERLKQTAPEEKIPYITKTISDLKDEVVEVNKALGALTFEKLQTLDILTNDSEIIDGTDFAKKWEDQIKRIEDGLSSEVLVELKAIVSAFTQEDRDKAIKYAKKLSDNFTDALEKAFDGDGRFKDLVTNFVGDYGGDIASNIIDNQMLKLEEAHQRKLELFDEEESRNAKLLENGVINQEQFEARKVQLEQKRRKEERKQKVEEAKADKKKALYDIAIATAVAMAKAGFVTAKAIAIGIAGAIQAGIVAAKKIPKFFKGVKNKQDDGLGIVGDQGSELVDIPGKGLQLFEQESTVFLPKGSDVYTSQETKKMLAKDDNRILEELQTLNRITRRKQNNVIVNVEAPKNYSSFENS